VAGARHERILRTSIEHYCGLPVLGAIPKQRSQRFPERHMGLVPTVEHQWANEAVTFIGDLAQKYLDLEAIGQIARAGRPGPNEQEAITVLPSIKPEESPANKTPSAAGNPPPSVEAGRPRIGVLRDSAFQFYYPENLEALEAAGAELVYTSPLNEEDLPRVDALYIGGGFPETHARRLSENRTYARSIRTLAEAGLPIYAECGGLMYMGRELVLPDGTFPMTDVLPVAFGFSKKPQGHGYTIVKVDGDNPYFEPGTLLRGHEFHYSTVAELNADSTDLVFVMERGNGIHQGRDGLCRNNVLATYTHIHALGTPQWAPALVRQALLFSRRAAD
jgi:cobyrinic acid a,c-diamide synthase